MATGTEFRRTVRTSLAVACIAQALLNGCASSANTPANRGSGSAPTIDSSSAGQSGASGLPADLGTQPTLVAIPLQPLGSNDGDAGDVCKAANAAAEKVPVDVFMMIDQSLSMVAPDASGTTRWASVIDALTKFVQAPESAGLSIGVQYFGLGLLGISCTASDYAMPEVEIAPLPGNAQALIDSFGKHGPSSVTPTAPALQGAIQHAQAFKLANPSHTVTVLLVTDGDPDSCGIDMLGDTVTAATQGVTSTPSIATYVLGVGSSLDALNQIAKAGGTNQAYIVDGAQDVSTQVMTALNKIRGTAVLPCEFQIPAADPGMPFDYNQVNLTYTTSGGQPNVIGYSTDQAKCDAAPFAWRYDNVQAPTKFMLCDTTCKTVASSGGKIDIALHCPTIPIVLK